MQFKLEVEEVDEASAELAKYRQDVSQPLIVQVLTCRRSSEAALSSHNHDCEEGPL